MTWSSPADLKRQVEKLWDKGLLLAALADMEAPFPRRLTLKTPNSPQLAEQFPAVQEWIASLSALPKGYRIEWRSVNHRILGQNTIPAAIWIDDLHSALRIIGKEAEAKRFAKMVALTRDRQPSWLPWLGKYPLRALALAEVWPQFLDIAAWLSAHPRPAIYIRQVDLPGIHSKLIEKHRGVLSELLDLAIAPQYIDRNQTGINRFSRRYGFLDKPTRVRFRLLDAEMALIPGIAEQDITLTQSAFAQLNLAVQKVFITENEINFLAFPALENSMVIFGAGYGFEHIAAADWLHNKALYYWGDIDTHGFAILNQLRQKFPHAVSIFMDEATLLAHQALWGEEDKPEQKILPHLTAAEQALYEKLCHRYWGGATRLEQERIGFGFCRETLRALSSH